MQYPSDDMDELFRKAAEDYPLNTNASDWSKMQAMLSPETSVSDKKTDKRKFLWLLLLLPLFFICNRVVTPGESDTALKQAKENITTANKQISGKQQERAVIQVGKETETKPSTVNTSVVNANNNNISPDVTRDRNIIDKSNSYDNRIQTSDPLVTTINNSRSKSKTRLINTGSNSLPEPLQGTDNSITSPATANNRKTTKNARLTVNTIGVIASPGATAKGAEDLETNKNEVTDKSASSLKEEQVNVTQNTGVTTADSVKSAATETTGDKDVAKEELINKPIDKKSDKMNGHPKHFYAGVVGGPDLSTIKFQKFSQVGFEAGIIIGYELNKKWAFEAGVFSDKKYYSTEGEYMNTSKLYLPPNTKVTAVVGNCRMIEIPILVRYTISSKANHSWYGAAGLSSYLMSREDYNYDYYYGSSGTTVTHNKVYDNSTKNWVSVLQLSAGYIQKLGKNFDLRVAPYYKLPLKGLGYTELPISSLGIHFGITKKLF